MKLSKSEIGIIQSLAQEYINYAQSCENTEKIKLWKALNRGEMQRPMVCIDQLPINELVCDDLVCKIINPYWRNIEWNLRLDIYKKKHFAADMVFNPFISIPKVVSNTGYGVTINRHIKGEEGSTALAQYFTPSISEIADVAKIKNQKIIYDKDLTELYFSEAKTIFNDVAPIFLRSHTGSMDSGYYLGLWDQLSQFLGIEESYMALYEDPDLVHLAMQRLTESTIAGIEQGNESTLHDDNANMCHCSYIYTDELLPDSGRGKGSYAKNSWAFGLAQIFTGISPQMFAEFEIPYIKKLAKYFGMIYYGCCDKLDDRLDLVKQIPNVKKISCSPWSDRKAFAEKIGTKIIMSNKPTPALLSTDSFNEDEIRRDLQLTCDLAKANNVNLEFILKDISTVRFDPTRLSRWEKIAMEVVSAY